MLSAVEKESSVTEFVNGPRSVLNKPWWDGGQGWNLFLLTKEVIRTKNRGSIFVKVLVQIH
jgi:hypothetical protein